MDIYRSGAIVSAVIPLIDETGLAVVPTAVSYRVLDEAGVELLATTPTGFVTGNTTVTVAVTALLNQLALDKLKGLRTIQLKATLASGAIVYLTYDYAIEVEATLVAMTNSYQTLGQAKLLTLDMPDQLAWMVADDRKRQAALVEAFTRIDKLRFNIYGMNIPTRNSLAVDSQVGDYYRTVASLNAFTKAEFDMLPAAFTSAVMKAQIIEADVILGGDPISKKREEGLMSDSVGQSSIMFRPGKPLIFAVSKRTLEQLSGWVTFSAQMGRA